MSTTMVNISTLASAVVTPAEEVETARLLLFAPYGKQSMQLTLNSNSIITIMILLFRKNGNLFKTKCMHSMRNWTEAENIQLLPLRRANTWYLLKCSDALRAIPVSCDFFNLASF